MNNKKYLSRNLNCGAILKIKTVSSYSNLKIRCPIYTKVMRAVSAKELKQITLK